MFYFILGALFVGIQILIRKVLVKMNKAKLWPNCILTLVANASILFSIAWAYASILEHETQAAMMGLLIFGGFGLIIAIVAYRLITKDNTVKSTNN